MDEITQIDLNHYQGTDKDFIFEIVNDDEEETAYNGLSNASFEAKQSNYLREQAKLQ